MRYTRWRCPVSVSLWDLLEWAGYIADTPGALTRGALAGRPGERVQAITMPAPDADALKQEIADSA